MLQFQAEIRAPGSSESAEVQHIYLCLLVKLEYKLEAGLVLSVLDMQEREDEMR